MMSGATAATTSAVYLAAIANAVKACGTVVRLEPEEFSRILTLIENRSSSGPQAVFFPDLSST
jgi:hypothetical protein